MKLILKCSKVSEMEMEIHSMNEYRGLLKHDQLKRLSAL